MQSRSRLSLRKKARAALGAVDDVVEFLQQLQDVGSRLGDQRVGVEHRLGASAQLIGLPLVVADRPQPILKVLVVTAEIGLDGLPHAERALGDEVQELVDLRLQQPRLAER
jgi:hypothetical protein